MGQNQAKLRDTCADPARCLSGPCAVPVRTLSGPCPEESGLKLTKFLRNELRIEPQGANVVTEAGGGVPGPKQLKNFENMDFGGLGVGGSPTPRPY